MSLRDKQLDARGTWLGNIADPKVRKILEIVPDSCYCFMFSPRWDGHDVNPPCATVKKAREIVEALND